jgi:putative hydrolase of the HAD superfamily
LNNLNFGISFDFWNTLYGNGDESERQKKRIEYFYDVISTYINSDYKIIDKAFHASKKFFIDEWQNNFRTPTVTERIRYMSEKLSVAMNKNDIEETANYFGKLIFTIPPQTNPQNLKIVRRLSQKYPIGLISDTGYISGKYIRQFLIEQDMISTFTSLVFSDEQRYCKPHPSVFKLTCTNLDISCSQLIHIGDLEKTDVQGAIDSGGISIKYTGWNDNFSKASRADYIINSYQELSRTITDIVNR